MEKPKCELADELIEMWSYALLIEGNTLTYDQYRELRKDFLSKLSEFEERIKGGNW